jgi:magnesium chelatase family protein
MIKKHCPLTENGKTLLEKAVEKYGLSPRAYHRIIRVARTIADMENGDHIGEPHIAEAIQYRVLDKRTIM